MLMEPYHILYLKHLVLQSYIMNNFIKLSVFASAEEPESEVGMCQLNFYLVRRKCSLIL